MKSSNTIKLYQTLKKAEPNGDFSAYEKRVKDYLISELNSFIQTFLTKNEIQNSTFFQTNISDVFALKKEIYEYIDVLTELIDLCNEYIAEGADISNLQSSNLFSGGKLNLSSVSAVKSVVSALETAHNGSGGRYLTQNPIEILLKPVTRNDEDEYKRTFMKTLGSYIDKGVVNQNNVIKYLQNEGCFFVSQSFVERVTDEANVKLTGTIREETKIKTHKTARSVFIPLFILLAIFCVPSITLSALNVHINNISGYIWIAVPAAGIVCGFLPMLCTILLEDKIKANFQLGNKKIKMFAAPFAAVCVALFIIFAIFNVFLWLNEAAAAPAATAFSVVYIVFYAVAVSLYNKEFMDGDTNKKNTYGLRHMFFWLLKILLPFCVSVPFAGNLGAYLVFNLMAIATCVLYEINYNAEIEALPSSFLTLGLSLSFALFITSLLALCRVDGLYLFYLILFDFNTAAMYAVCIIFFLILFVACIALAVYNYREDNVGLTVVPIVIMLTVSIVVYAVGFVKLDKTKKSDDTVIVDNCVLLLENGALKRAYGFADNLVIPSKVKSISANAFDKSFSANAIEVGMLDNIEKGAFAGCKNLKSISLPFIGSNFYSSGSSYFGGIFGKENYKGAVKVIYNGENYYLPSKLTSVTVRGGEVGNSAFTNCSLLTDVEFGKNVESVGSNVFYGCTAIENLTLPYIGLNNSENNTTEFTLLGNLFSKTQTEGFVPVTQYYSENRSKTYYVPSSLKNVTVSGGKIWYGAFSNFNMLKSVKLEEGVYYVDESVLYGCSSLEELTVPFVGWGEVYNKSGFFGHIFGSVEFKGADCIEQERIDSYGWSEKRKFYIPKSLKSVIIKRGEISGGAFFGCKNIEKITFPSDMESLGCNAFTGCTKLIKSVDGVKYVNDWVVGYENFYKSAKISAGTVGVSDGAFNNANSLKSVTVPESVAYMGVDAFINCPELKDVNYLGTVEKWIEVDFKNEHSSPVKQNFFIKGKLLTKLVVPQNLEIVPRYAFCNFRSLESLTISEGIKNINEGAFSGCINLTEINFNTNDCPNFTLYSNLFAYAGQNSNGITVNIGNKVEVIPEYLFFTEDDGAAPNVVKLKFEENSVCTTIENYSFANCVNLKEVTLPNSVTTVRPYAFADCTSLAECENGIYYASNWVIGYENGITQAVIRTNTLGIIDNAFANCLTLTSVTVPSTVKQIGDNVFKNCKALTEATIPFTIEKYGISNFKTCARLKKLTCASGTFVRFITFYNSDGSENAQKLLRPSETISADRLSQQKEPVGYFFCGWYTDKSLNISNLKTEITTNDTGFINLYPCYLAKSIYREIPAENKSWSKTNVKNKYSASDVTIDVSRMYRLRAYGYRFNFNITYNTYEYSSVKLTTGHGHTTDYTGSCKTEFKLSYFDLGGNVSHTVTGPSVSAKLGSNWISGGSKTEYSKNLVDVDYGYKAIYGETISLTATYCYNVALGQYGKAVFYNPPVEVCVNFSKA